MLKKNKSLIRHEILNLFTLVNFEVSSAHLNEERKENILKQLKGLSLLINYEDMFLGEERKILKTPMDINEILDTILMIHQNEIERRKIKLSLPSDEMIVKIDRKSVQEALDQIFIKLIEGSKKISVTYNKKVLNIVHDLPVVLPDKVVDLLGCLIGQVSCLDFGHQLALHLLKLNGAKVKSTKGLIKITFA